MSNLTCCLFGEEKMLYHSALQISSVRFETKGKHIYKHAHPFQYLALVVDTLRTLSILVATFGHNIVIFKLTKNVQKVIDVKRFFPTKLSWI